MNFIPETLIFIALGLIALLFVTQIIFYIVLKKSIAAIPHVTINDSLQSQINDLIEVNKKQAALNQKVTTDITTILPRLENISKSATVRYNPFRDAGVGGLQSFSTALLDNHGNGILLTNLYSREMSRVSVKEIQNWECESQKLSPEESMVIKKLQD